MKKSLLIALFLLVLVLFVIVTIRKEAEAPDGKNSGSSSKSNKTSSPGFDKSRYSIDDPASLWVVVNKQRPLPGNFIPGNLIAAGNGEFLRRDAAQSLSKLIAAADTDGVYLRVVSGYRSYNNQQSTYNSYINSDSRQNVDNYSARAGHSEHQTGLAADLGNSDGYCDLDVCFAGTAGGQWLAENARQFGFIIRYQKGKESITGYQPEPWHLRYVGKGLAKEIKSSGLAMEEFFSLPAAPSY
jgi:D-alanyl-D-alanine carboxypeptidase